MNVLLFHAHQRQDNLVIVESQEKLQHLNQILKLKAGDSLRVGEINGLLGQASVEKISTQKCTLNVNLDTQPPTKLPCTLILALPRPQQLKRILMHSASLGIKEIHLIQTEKVEKNYWQSPKLKDIENYLLEGLEQAKDTLLPVVEYHTIFKHFCENTLQQLLLEKTCWLAQPGNYPKAQNQLTGEHLIVVGPEGGFSAQEVDLFIQQGCKPINLGTRILKTETAIPALVGKMFL